MLHRKRQSLAGVSEVNSTNIRRYLLFVFHRFSLLCLRTVIVADAQVNILVNKCAGSQSNSNHHF